MSPRHRPQKRSGPDATPGQTSGTNDSRTLTQNRNGVNGISTVDQILDRWPLTSMLARLGIQIPERGKFRSPFRPDENPSCEIYGQTIKDRSTGETYDAIRVFAEIKGLTNSEAIKQLAEELPGRHRKPEPKPTRELRIPETVWSLTKAQELASLRGLGEESTRIAGAVFGTLGFAKVGGFDCWVLSDADRKLCEARRMDGKSFPAVGDIGERKAHTLRGSCKSWPLGMRLSRFIVPEQMPILLVEGGGDYLAACDILFHAKKEFLPVAMMGASQSIHTEALPFFRGRNVTILAHPDGAGLESAKRWAAQIKSIGGRPQARQLEGGDLNDLVREHGAKSVAEGFDL